MNVERGHQNERRLGNKAIRKKHPELTGDNSGKSIYKRIKKGVDQNRTDA